MEPEAYTSLMQSEKYCNMVETSSVSGASEESLSSFDSSSVMAIDEVEEDDDYGDWGFLQTLETKTGDLPLKKRPADVKLKGVITPCYLRGSDSEEIDTSESAEEMGEPSKRLCLICNDFKTAKEIEVVVKCKHDFCVDCLEDYILKEVKESGFPVKCPEKDCKKDLPDSLLQCVPREQVDRWEASRKAWRFEPIWRGGRTWQRDFRQFYNSPYHVTYLGN